MPKSTKKSARVTELSDSAKALGAELDIEATLDELLLEVEQVAPEAYTEADRCAEIEEALHEREALVSGLERDYQDAAGDPGVQAQIAKDLDRWAQYLEAGYLELADCRGGFLPEESRPF